jgi:hypothetical protein
MQIEINNVLEILDQWTKTWLVHFNTKNTKALIISNNTNIPELNIRFNDKSVAFADNHTHLGVTLASDGNWTVHIENIATSALKKKQVNVLRKLKFTLSKQALSNIYLTFIRPVLEYACEVWDGCYERDIEKLEKIQLEEARIATGSTTFACKDSLYFETG